MWNEDLKNGFIKEMRERSKDSDLIMKYVFRIFAPTEDELQKDACNFTAKEIMSVYKCLFTPSYETLITANGNMKYYTRYMLQHNMVNDGQNHYEEIDRELLMSCLDVLRIDQSVISRENLIRLIEDNLVNPADKFLTLAVFEGIGGYAQSEFYELRMNNFDGNIVTLTEQRRDLSTHERKLEVSDHLVKYAAESAVTYETVLHRTESTSDSFYATRPLRADDDRIIKAQPQAQDITPDHKRYFPAMRARIYNQMQRINNEINGFILGLMELAESGRIDMIKKFMKEEDKDPREAILAHREEIEYRYGTFTSNSVPKYVMKYEKYLKG